MTMKCIRLTSLSCYIIKVLKMITKKKKCSRPLDFMNFYRLKYINDDFTQIRDFSNRKMKTFTSSTH